MKRLTLALLMLLLSNFTYSYGIYNGTVKDVRIDRGGWGIIAFDGPVVGNPATCRSTFYTSQMSFDANTEGGKAIFAMALAAVASGKQVSVIGTGLCNDYANTVEGLSYWHFLK